MYLRYKMNIDEAKRILDEHKYRYIKENRTLDVESLVVSYKKRIMTALRQKFINMADKLVNEGEANTECPIVLEFPTRMEKVPYRDPVKMKALTVKFYTERNKVRKDFDALRASAQGETCVELDPVVIWFNMPVIDADLLKEEYEEKVRDYGYNYSRSYGSYGGYGSYSRYGSYGGYGSSSRSALDDDDDDEWEMGYRRGIWSEAAESDKNDDLPKLPPPTPEEKAAAKQPVDIHRPPTKKASKRGKGTQEVKWKIVKRIRQKDFIFDDIIEEYLDEDLSNVDEAVDAIIEDYFGDWFQEVMHHELTHFMQANNLAIDGTENAKEYDASEVMRTGAYGVDPLEYEAKLHQLLYDNIEEILDTKNLASVAKKYLSRLYSNRLQSIPEPLKRKCFSEILKLCQVIKSTPGITPENYNTPEMLKKMQEKL